MTISEVIKPTGRAFAKSEKKDFVALRREEPDLHLKQEAQRGHWSLRSIERGVRLLLLECDKQDDRMWISLDRRAAARTETTTNI
jgi:hypothetical protein